MVSMLCCNVSTVFSSVTSSIVDQCWSFCFFFRWVSHSIYILPVWGQRGISLQEFAPGARSHREYYILWGCSWFLEFSTRRAKTTLLLRLCVCQFVTSPYLMNHHRQFKLLMMINDYYLTKYNKHLRRLPFNKNGFLLILAQYW